MRFAQGVYPICQDDENAVAFVEFVHLHGTSLLQAASNPWVPQVYVSIMEGVRIHMLRSGSATGIFRPDNQAKQHETTKNFLHSFSIRFLIEHTSTDSTCGLEVLPTHDYQG